MYKSDFPSICIPSQFLAICPYTGGVHYTSFPPLVLPLIHSHGSVPHFPNPSTQALCIWLFSCRLTPGSCHGVVICSMGLSLPQTFPPDTLPNWNGCCSYPLSPTAWPYSLHCWIKSLLHYSSPQGHCNLSVWYPGLFQIDDSISFCLISKFPLHSPAFCAKIINANVKRNNFWGRNSRNCTGEPPSVSHIPFQLKQLPCPFQAALYPLLHFICQSHLLWLS